MSDIYRDLNDFLRQHKAIKGDVVTHTRIGNIGTPEAENGNTIFPGKYSIPDEKLPQFFKLYNRHVFVNSKEEYLTEIQLKNGTSKLVVDLDFRYDPSVRDRQHCGDHITDICDIYTDVLQNLVEFNNKDILNCYVFEKDSANTSNDNVTKDGIHIVFDMCADHALQQLVRSKVLRQIGDVIEELPLTNNYDSVLDEGISKGTTGWQLYGSRKPGYDVYKLVRHVEYSYNKEDSDFTYNNVSLANINHLKYLSMVSVRMPSSLECKVKEEYKELYESFKPKKKMMRRNISKKKPSNPFTIHGIEDTIGNVKSVDDMEKVIKMLFEFINDNEYMLKETHAFTMGLPAQYYNDYDKWIRVGWALRNCDFRMFWTWMLFSSQSEKFSFDKIGDFFDMWVKFDFDNDGLTERSIMYWLSQDNHDEFISIRNNTVDHFIRISADSGAEWDIANVVYHFYKDKYRCASIKNNIWYEYIGHQWVEIDSGGSLRNNISKFLSRRYGDLSTNIVGASSGGNVDPNMTPEQNERVKNRALSLSVLATKLKKTNFKQCVMRECTTVFHEADKYFYSRLDKNRMLLGFKNGVFDFTKKEFRAGRPEDYISLNTNIDYVPIDHDNAKHITIMGEIRDFMKTLFPDETLCEYMWNHLASVMIGGNKPQTFNIYNG